MERLSKRSVCQIQSTVRIYFQRGKGRVLRHYVHEGKDLFLLIKELNEVNLNERLWTLSNRQSIWWFQSVDKRYFTNVIQWKGLANEVFAKYDTQWKLTSNKGKGEFQGIYAHGVKGVCTHQKVEWNESLMKGCGCSLDINPFDSFFKPRIRRVVSKSLLVLR